MNGMGPAKLQRYGVQLLSELQAHYAEQSRRRHAASRPPPLRRPNAEPATDAPPEFMTRKFSEQQLKVREQHPRAYERWSDEEDGEVISLHQGGATPAEIAQALQRQPNAIEMRMERLELIAREPAAS